MGFLNLDQVNVKDKTVVVRVDINSPIDTKTGEILDDTRMRLCVPTLKELVSKGAKVVVLAHQGRPGGEDFTTLEKHAKQLSELLNLQVHYIPDPVCPSAIEKIRKLRSGEVALLENVRMLAEEVAKIPAEKQVHTHMVRLLKSVAHLYVNDAFGAVHRSSPSLVGLAEVLPAYAGRLMEKELKGLGRALNPEHPCVYVLGGVKFDDSLKIIEHVLGKGIADVVLTGGLVSQAFLAAVGVDLGEPNMEFIKSKGFEEHAERAKHLAEAYGDKILVPADVVVESGGEAKPVEINPNASEFSVKEMGAAQRIPVTQPVYDIGPKTVAKYAEVIKGAKTVVANGPLGVFERKGFEQGTYGVLKAMAESKAYTVIGGGHIVAATNAAGVANKMSHVSTGGGAAITFLSGGKLPVVEALTKAAEKVGT